MSGEGYERVKKSKGPDRECPKLYCKASQHLSKNTGGDCSKAPDMASCSSKDLVGEANLVMGDGLLQMLMPSENFQRRAEIFWQKYLKEHPDAEADGEIDEIPPPPAPVGQKRKRKDSKLTKARWQIDTRMEKQDDLIQSRASRSSKSGSSNSLNEPDVIEEMNKDISQLAKTLTTQSCEPAEVDSAEDNNEKQNWLSSPETAGLCSSALIQKMNVLFLALA